MTTVRLTINKNRTTDFSRIPSSVNCVEHYRSLKRSKQNPGIEEIFVKLPINENQSIANVYWKDFKIVAIELIDQTNGMFCFAKQFESPVSMHSLGGIPIGTYLATLTLENGQIKQRILVTM